MLEIIDSRIARQEYEERIRSLQQVVNYDSWLTDKAGSWLAQQAGSLLSSLGNGLVALGEKLAPRETEADGLDTLLPDQERTPAGR
jgi:hypothetical protein